MRILAAPQGFKGTLTGVEAARAVAEGARRVFPDAEVVEMPVADGGHGTLDAMLAAADGERRSARVLGPLSEAVEAGWGLLPGNIAVIEMAQASGLTLVPEARHDPMQATTYGVGQLIAAALDEGVSRVIVGVGGSATNDGGAGAAQALGVRLLDAEGRDIPLGAEGLLSLASIDIADRRPALGRVALEVAADVSNPLTGPTGAAMTYGLQKGASPSQLLVLDAALGRMADVVERELGLQLRDVPGMGAAGGLSAGLVALAGARLLPGAKVVLDALRFDSCLDGVSLVITGEGRLDWQTVYDKAPIEVARRAQARGIPALAVAGSLGRGADDALAHGIALAEACSKENDPLPATSDEAAARLADAAERAVRRWSG